MLLLFKLSLAVGLRLRLLNVYGFIVLSAIRGIGAGKVKSGTAQLKDRGPGSRPDGGMRDDTKVKQCSQ